MEASGQGVLLAFCFTCKTLRPPRSFHCTSCNTCVEVHDHHCPWVGTCVGRRNFKFFACFLMVTATTAFVTFILSVTYLMGHLTANPDEEGRKLLAIFLTIYTGIFMSMLFGYSVFINYQILSNVTTNETTRGKWFGMNRIRRMRSSLPLPGKLDRLKEFYLKKSS